MRSPLLLLALFTSVLSAQPADPTRVDIQLNTGRTMRAAKVLSITSDRVTISHRDGIELVNVADVPLDILTRAAERLAASRTSRERAAEEIIQREAVRRDALARQSNIVVLPDAKPRTSERTELRATGALGPRTTPENGCVVCTNAEGRGTGFVLRQADGFVLVSNQHVIDGGPPHRYELPGARSLKPLGGFLASDRDIVAMDLDGADFPHYFEMEPDVDAVALGEDVIIYGNSEGKGLRLSKAKLLAKSPEQIEVSTGIVHGNSGGPIVRAKTGRVIGVSTYVRVRRAPRSISDLVEDAVLPKVQFYGVRIDNLKKTSEFDLGRFVAESVNLDADEKRLRDGLTVLACLVSSGGHASREVQDMAERATPEVHRLLSASRVDPLLFRQRVRQLFRPISVGTSFIHAEKRERLDRTRSALAKLFRELYPQD